MERAVQRGAVKLCVVGCLSAEFKVQSALTCTDCSCPPSLTPRSLLARFSSVRSQSFDWLTTHAHHIGLSVSLFTLNEKSNQAWSLLR